MRAVLLATLLLTASLASLVPTASATINTSATALQVAQAMFTNPAIVTGASWVAKPPSGTPDAVSDTPLSGFPTAGTTYGMLTSGDANLAPNTNCCPNSGAADGGGNVRGNTDFDVTILKIDFTVQVGNCLTVGDFRFFSDEFPEYVGTSYNDAFIAELDSSTWTTSGSTISAPNDFALDPSGHVISINAAGPATMTAGDAAGTTYDGGTPTLTLSSPISAGAHSLYFSIFDQGDQIYDSAVFIDNIAIENVPADQCKTGITEKPVHGQADCEAYGVRVIERDLTTGQIVGDLESNLSRSAAHADSIDGAWPATIPPPGSAPVAPNPAQAHADAQQAGFYYHNNAADLTVSTSSVDSRCDVAALRDPATNAVYAHAYGRGGLQDLGIHLGSTLDLHAEALDFEAMAVGLPSPTFGSAACEIVEVNSASACTAPWTTPVSAHVPGALDAALTFNEQWGALGGNPWLYGGDAAHLCVVVDTVTRIDVYVGLVNVSATGGGATTLWPPMPDPCGASAPPVGQCPPPSVGVPPACVTTDCNLPASFGVACPDPTPKCPPPTSGAFPNCKAKPTPTPKCPPPTSGTLPNCAIAVGPLVPIIDCSVFVAGVCDELNGLVAAQAISVEGASRPA